MLFFFLMIRRPPRSTLFPTRRSSDLRHAVRGMEGQAPEGGLQGPAGRVDRKSTRLNSSHGSISYAVFCLKKKNIPNYKEFYEGRWFAAAATARSRSVVLGDQEVPFGTDLLFDAEDVEGLVLCFFFNDTATTEISTLSLHAALPI